MKVLAVVSGGMDSVTMLHDLVAQGHEVSVVSFNYGQRHLKELEVAKANADKLGLKHKVIDMAFMAQLLDNSALTGDTDVPEGHYEADNMKLTVVPNRNMIMASIAVGLAVNNGQEAVALGVHSGDHAIYPDCRPEFIKELNDVTQIANYEPITILAPYIDKDKTSIIKRGLEIGVDYSKTWTCYKGLNKACGKCGSCQERLEAFRNNNKEDPVDYETRELITS
ncbi:7-cyano-7-deazaguanine synthase QueC [Candidatus Saccharibacteria bacterium]|nr:7-cyano-7-deazaguanine synthase QueC [Candidatus Saccharibacteria bacterium]